MEVKSISLEETLKLGESLGSLLQKGDVVGLIGPLGVGKTALVNGIAKGLEVDSRYPVTSPTFVFAHIYYGKIPVYHIDLYRIEKESELKGIGIEEMLDGDGVCVVEWFDRFPNIWNEDRMEVYITFGKGEERWFNLCGFGPMFKKRKNALERLGWG